MGGSILKVLVLTNGGRTEQTLINCASEWSLISKFDLQIAQVGLRCEPLGIQMDQSRALEALQHQVQPSDPSNSRMGLTKNQTPTQPTKRTTAFNHNPVVLAMFFDQPPKLVFAEVFDMEF